MLLFQKIRPEFPKKLSFPFKHQIKWPDCQKSSACCVTMGELSTCENPVPILGVQLFKSLPGHASKPESKGLSCVSESHVGSMLCCC